MPFGPPPAVRAVLRRATGLSPYPDRSYTALRAAIAAHHGLDPAWVLPGNGAAELFTWAARDAAAAGTSLLPAPGFADYRRALTTWNGAHRALPLPLHWPAAFPQPFPLAIPPDAVLWLCQPHNPTGQLWSLASLQPLLERCRLLIVDEAFLPLTSGGEAHSLLPFLERHPQLVVIRSLTKLFAIAGLRLGYALAHPDRLARWASWRDPWPVNGLAAAVGERLLADPAGLAAWQRRVLTWLTREGPALAAGLADLPGLTPLPTATNFLLVRGDTSLEPLRRGVEHAHRILLRDCRSFTGLDDRWLRIALLDRRGNRRLLRALGRQIDAGALQDPGS